MKKLLLSTLVIVIAHCSLMAQTTKLFDGKTTAGWHTYLKPGNAGAWKVVHGALQLDPKAKNQGDLLTDKEYENFELSLEWKIAEGGNSGIIFSIHEDPVFDATYRTGIEMQILDDQKAEDNKQGTHLAGALYDMKAPSHAANPAGKWNKIILRKQNGNITFYMNGVKTVEVKIGSRAWKAMIDHSKFKTWKEFAAYPKGRIALQDHGAVVSFKDITIQEL